MGSGTDGTAEHRTPRRPAASLSRPAWLAAYPSAAGLALELDQPLGRDWLRDHDAADHEVSGKHIEMTRDSGVLRVRDVGSRNGSWLDGRPLPSGHWVDVRDGAVLRLGSSLLVYREQLAGPLAPSPPLGALVAPYGLRDIASTLDALKSHPPRNVLVQGETGTGKELVAHAVAAAFGRAPLTAVNVAGVASGVFESQLFGHVAGAFSDARRGAKGIVLTHDGGAIFLDEIGELALELQPKLLRLLDNREVLPVGADTPQDVDVLIIAATNRDLEREVAAGSFRRDLLARLESAVLELPPLRERAEDVYSIVRALAPAVGSQVEPDQNEVEAVERLMLDEWPSNVRGLRAALTKLRALDPEPGLHLWSVERVLGPAPSSRDGMDAAQAREALEACGGNESHAARHLGISRGKLRRLLGKA
jgi:hypothetical protein